jgi:IS30 family transposase
MENQRKRRKLSLMTRETIYSMRRQGCKIREIARHVGFDASVVSREFKRNRPPSKVVLVTGIERAGWAHAQAQRRLKERKRGKRGAIMKPAVYGHIIDQLVDKRSPEAIAATMKEAIGEKVSYSTIYRWIKKDSPILTQYLYEKGKPRRQRVMNRRGALHASQAAPIKRSYEDRPEEAKARTEVGHLEGDTIHGCKKSNAAIVSIRDMNSRIHLFAKTPNLEASTVTRVIIMMLLSIPIECRKTLTFDRGSEFANWDEIEKAFPEIKVYFCDAYCPHQKGSNERGNRDFRKYYPKGSNFDAVNEDQVHRAQEKINNSPMKLHKWKSPAQIAPQLLVAA